MERRKEQQKRVGGGEGRVSNRQLEMGAGGNGGMQWGAKHAAAPMNARWRGVLWARGGVGCSAIVVIGRVE
tara:strand:- start:259 stop:471 length:213 start_codon:yes stop_codon:yes gene_type:complete